MKDIKCPSCGKNFKIDPSNYDQLLSQIKNDEFNKQIDERLYLAKKEKNKEIELVKTELKLEMIKEKKEMEKVRSSKKNGNTWKKLGVRKEHIGFWLFVVG